MAVALPRMVAPRRGFRSGSGTLFRSKNGRPKQKRNSPQNERVFGLNEDRDQTKQKKKGIHHKSVELRFHTIIWCHPKIVTPGAGSPPPQATPLPMANRLKTTGLGINNHYHNLPSVYGHKKCTSGQRIELHLIDVFLKLRKSPTAQIHILITLIKKLIRVRP